MEDNTLKNLSDRCRRICADNSSPCFIENRNQITCIADMLINKVYYVKEAVELAARENKSDSLAEILNSVAKNIDELTNWVKFLQISHDLKSLSTLDADSGVEEKRREKRFPLPDIYRKYIIMEVNLSGSPAKASLIDFSPRGVRFSSTVQFDADSIQKCRLSILETDEKEKEFTFSVKVKFCAEQGGQFITGGEIEEIDGNTFFDFFKKVEKFILDILKGRYKR